MLFPLDECPSIAMIICFIYICFKAVQYSENFLICANDKMVTFLFPSGLFRLRRRSLSEPVAFLREASANPRNLPALLREAPPTRGTSPHFCGRLPPTCGTSPHFCERLPHPAERSRSFAGDFRTLQNLSRKTEQRGGEASHPFFFSSATCRQRNIHASTAARKSESGPASQTPSSPNA